MIKPITFFITLASVLVAAGIIFLLLSVHFSGMTNILVLPMPMYASPAILFVAGAIFLQLGSRVAQIGLAILFGFSASGFMLVSLMPYFVANVPLEALLWPMALGMMMMTPALILVFSNRLRHELAAIRESRSAN